MVVSFAHNHMNNLHPIWELFPYAIIFHRIWLSNCLNSTYIRPSEALLFHLMAIGYKPCPIRIPILVLVVHDGAKVLGGHAKDSGLPSAAVEVKNIKSRLHGCKSFDIRIDDYSEACSLCYSNPIGGLHIPHDGGVPGYMKYIPFLVDYNVV